MMDPLCWKVMGSHLTTGSILEHVLKDPLGHYTLLFLINNYKILKQLLTPGQTTAQVVKVVPTTACLNLKWI